ncbi:MAG: Tex family protein [Candidatus Hydrogenedentota bacterium]
MVVDEILGRVALDVSIDKEKVAKTIELLNAGSTIPFIARYRKDVTGQLNEVQLEAISERNQYFISMQQRRDSILETIRKQEKLTPELEKRILACWDKNALEDLYLPYKRQRRTKATVAREQGLEPLADFLFNQVEGEVAIDAFAESFVNPAKEVPSIEGALEGARFILAERISIDFGIRAYVRDRMMEESRLAAHSTKLSDGKKTKYSSYYEFNEVLKNVVSHRMLAILRGVKEALLRMEVVLDDESIQQGIVGKVVQDASSEYATHLIQAIDDSYKRLILPSIENEVIGIARKKADDHAIKVFRDNAYKLLLAAPAGRIAVIGLDPGLRTGCKLAVIDTMGNYVESDTIHLQASEEARQDARSTLVALMKNHKAMAIAIGNGTGSREAHTFVKVVIASEPEISEGFCVLVNEAGASIYSASKIAREEFPDLDVTIRGAISIARRLQDPLAELVKIEPRSVGVGQYQHDVNQKILREGLHRTVVSCVNKVGVDLNTASVPLLRYVSGVQYGTAQHIVARRNEIGGFKNRQQLLDVDGIGPKVFEQCAGFLRIHDEENALDSTAIHPESYDVVEAMATALNSTSKELIGNTELLKKLELEQFNSDSIGTLTLKDIVNELRKPSRDPRKKFEVPEFIEGVESIKDLNLDMELQGVVTNVTDFGAFVDVGVHQDGLVHLSEMANRFVRDPLEVVGVGDIVRVKVIGIDVEMPRISLSIKALLPPPAQKAHRRRAAASDKKSDGDKARRERPVHAKGKAKGKPARSKDTRRSGKKQGRPKQTQPATSTEGMNTQLADQLASLKARFND